MVSYVQSTPPRVCCLGVTKELDDLISYHRDDRYVRAQYFSLAVFRTPEQWPSALEEYERGGCVRTWIPWTGECVQETVFPIP